MRQPIFFALKKIKVDMYYDDNTQLFLNGEFVPAKNATTSLFAQTLHYGSGVFEGIRAYETENGTRIFKAKEHYERLRYSAKMMHIDLKYSVQELETASYEVLKRNHLTNAYLRPLVYLGENMKLCPTKDVNVVIMAWEWGAYLGEKLLNIKISPYQRPNKHSCHIEAKVVGHYINSILATTDAEESGFDEALLKDSDGFLAEGPGENLFFEKDGKLYTPALGNILSGITRKTVLEIASEQGIPCVEGQYTEEDIKTADSAFFCGTAAEIAGIRKLDDYVFPLDWNQSLGKKIQTLYKQTVLKNTVNA